MRYYLAIDQGTQSSRAVLFNSEGAVVAQQQKSITIKRPSAHYVEQDGEEILNSIRQVVKDLLASIPNEQLENISACGLCTQRSSVIACDQQGNALSPVISWQDSRASQWLNQLSDQEPTIKQLSGLPLTPYYGASKLRWLQVNLEKSVGSRKSAQSIDMPGKPEKALITSKVTTSFSDSPFTPMAYTSFSRPTDFSRLNYSTNTLLAPLVSYLLLNLLNEKPYVVDHSNAQRMQLFNIHKFGWSSRLLNLFEINSDRLPECKPVIYNYGKLLDTDIPLTAVCGDQNAVFSGAGHLSSGTAIINLGSGAFVLSPQQSSQTHEKLLTSLVRSDHQSTLFALEGTVNGAGNALKWAAKKYQLGDLKQRLPGWIKTTKNPPVFINTIGGVGSPWWLESKESEFLPAAQHSAQHHSKAEIAVAVVESIVFLLVDNLLVMQQSEQISRIQLSGGLSNLDGLCQKLADLIEIPVFRVNNVEASARGVAWLAAGQPDSWSQNIAAKFVSRDNPGLKKRYQLFGSTLTRLATEK